MILYDRILYESKGSNDLVMSITNHIFNKINSNFGKLLLNKELVLNNNLSDFKDVEFINDKITIRITDNNYGSVNISKLDISDSINNLILNLNFSPTPTEIKSKEIYKTNTLYGVISHEILHVIELYLTELNDKKRANSWNQGEKLQYLQNKYDDYNWTNISYIIYLSLPHEMRASIQQLNTDMKDKDINFVKNTKIYKDVQLLSNIKSHVLLNDLKKDYNYLNILNDFNKLVLNKNNSEYNFIKYIDDIILRNKKMLKKLNKIPFNKNEFISEDYFDHIIKYDDFNL